MEKQMITQLKQQNIYLRALLKLAIRQQGSTDKLESVLSESGLGYQEIAELLGKKPDAVRMYLKRNKSI